MEFNKQKTATQSSVSDAIIDQGLRSYMLKVYNYMASGVALTGFIALFLFKMAVVSGPNGEILGLTQLGNTLFNSGFAPTKRDCFKSSTALIHLFSFGLVPDIILYKNIIFYP